MAGAFENPEGVLASGQTLFVADRAFPGGRDGRVLAVDLRTGAVRVLASGLSDPRGLAMSRGMLLVSDRCRGAIYAIQPASGRIRTLSRGGLLRRPIGIAVRGGTVCAADYDSGTNVAVERSGRQRTFARGGS